MNSHSNEDIKYWRSIDYRKRSLEYTNSIRDEFRDGDSEITGLQRREMLKLMGASMALAGLGTACRRPEEKILPYSRAPEDVIPGVPNYFATARSSALGAIGLVVESHENRPTKVEGNDKHPSSLGAASSHDQASVIELYDPDRSRAVTKGNVASTWKEWDVFAKNHFAEFLASKGDGLAIVYDGHNCPTQERQLKDLKSSMPRMQIYAYDPLIEVNTAAGAALAFGPDARVLMNYEKARIIVTVHADPFMNGPAALKNARGFAQGRKIMSAKEAEQMNRLYSVEAQYTVTGANADHRLRAPVSSGGDFLCALAMELGHVQNFNLNLSDAIKARVQGGQGQKFESKFVTALAKDLAKNNGKSLICVGESQEPWVHALGHAINTALAGMGQTFRVVKSNKLVADFSDFAGLSTLAQNLSAGKIKTLVTLGVNLAYATPESLKLKELLNKAQTVVHAGIYADETAHVSNWHLPMSHFLEAFGDVAAWDGTVSLQQPLISPLHDTRSIVELLSQIQTGKAGKGYELVKATWTGKGGALEKDKAWRAALHDGIVDGTAFVVTANASPDGTAISREIAKAAIAKPPTAEAVEVVFEFDNRLLDGRYANLAWLQELPDAITKLTWDNALYVSPAAAKKFGIKSRVKDRYYRADIVHVTTPNGSVKAPAFVVPGLNEFSVVAILGYGRTNAGTIGSGIGYNAFAMFPSNGARSVQGATLQRTGETFDLASTQEQFAMNAEVIQEISTFSMQERDTARYTDVGSYKKEANYVAKKGLSEELMYEEDGKKVPLQNTDPWQYKGNKWGMVIDLTTCIGCNACVTACQAENNIPIVGKQEVMRSRVMHWIRVDRYFTGDVNAPMTIAQPIPCMHCENAPCEPVCPVAATVHDTEGINAMVYNRCVGTRYCGNNCPYKVRRFNFLDFSHSGDLYVDDANKERAKLLSMQLNPDVSIRYRGVMEKCSYCIQRIQQARFEATRKHEDTIKDGAVTPACAQTCPTQAITFGNMNDANSRVSKLKVVDRNYDLLSELNVRPRTSYLGKLRNPNPELV